MNNLSKWRYGSFLGIIIFVNSIIYGLLCLIFDIGFRIDAFIIPLIVGITITGISGYEHYSRTH